MLYVTFDLNFNLYNTLSKTTYLRDTKSIKKRQQYTNRTKKKESRREGGRESKKERERKTPHPTFAPERDRESRESDLTSPR